MGAGGKAVQLRERFEDPLQLVGWNAWTRIPHFEHDAGEVHCGGAVGVHGRGPRMDDHFTAGSEFHRIACQVRQHLPDAPAIPTDPRG